MQLGFKGIFYTVFPDIGVICIFQEVVFFVLLLCHQPDIAEQVRGILRVVVAHISTGDFDTCQLVLHDGGNQPHARILDEHIVRRVNGITHIDGIANPRNQTHLFRRIAVVDIIAGAHVGHQFNRSRILRKIVSFIPKVGLQHRTLDLRHIRVVLKRRGKRNGEIIGIVIPITADHIYQIKNNTVRILAGK